MSEVKIFKAQPGPQTKFLACTADILFYGGAAGGGKTYGLLLDNLRHLENELYRSVIFRRESVQISNPGGLWDEANNMYRYFTDDFIGRPNFEVNFPSGAQVKFAHLNQESDIYNWQGAQVAYLGFDEVTHFSEKQFFYLLSRARTMSGVSSRVRATCNPDPDSWVAKFIEWWIDQDEKLENGEPNPNYGLPILERAGVLRWFIKIGDEYHWANTKEELIEEYGNEVYPKSVTFIPSKITDNQILLQNDPQYLANLNAQSAVDRARLLGGNWKIKAVAGELFQRSTFPIVDSMPAPNAIVKRIRYWDRAATKPSPENPNPDWTVGLLLVQDGSGLWYVQHVERFRDTPAGVKRRIKEIANQDGYGVMIGIEEDPGQAGVSEADDLQLSLAGYVVKRYRPAADKITRAKPVSAISENGHVRVLRAPWNDTFFNELESFGENTIKDKKVKKDQVDAFSGAFNALSGSGANVLLGTSQL